jgi:hypothetical protein
MAITSPSTSLCGSNRFGKGFFLITVLISDEPEKDSGDDAIFPATNNGPIIIVTIVSTVIAFMDVRNVILISISLFCTE